MKNTLETRLGIFVALAIVAAVLIIEMVGGFESFWGQRQYYGLFNNVQELKVGDRVKMAGVEIGKVEEIELAENKVKVTMAVHKGAVIRTDSVATVKFTGLLGQNFVSIDFGSAGAGPLDAGQYITTAEQADLNAIMAKLDNVATGVENLTKSFTGVDIDKLLGPLLNILEASEVPLTETITNIQRITAQISQGQGTVGKLIFDDSLHTAALNTVSNLQFATDDIKITLAEARKVVDQVNAGQGTIGKLVKDETLYNETTASMTNLKEILQKINQGQGTIGKLVNDQEFYKNAKLSLQKLDKATEGLEDQGPLSILGIAVNSLF